MKRIPHRFLAILLLFLLRAGMGSAADFNEANRILRDGAIEYGNRHFDPATCLVRRVDGDHDQLDVCQHSLEYAAALLSASQQLDRAASVVSAVLDHQDLEEDSPTFGNFRWWHGEERVRDRNAVAFMSPWLAHIALEHRGKLDPALTERLHRAMRHCIQGVRNHRSGPDYTNIWLLKAASLVCLGRALEEPELQADAAKRIDAWIQLVAAEGIGEYNSPAYSAVNIYALEWIFRYATGDELHKTVTGCLDFLYADAFQNWHWEAGIGAGPHSRANERDRDTGHSLVSCLVFKQCGQPLRQPLRSFLYVFAVNDYPLSPAIRAGAPKRGMYPFESRSRILSGAEAVDCSLYMTPRFSLGTQTGRRPVYNDRPLWDIPFKITYAGTGTERRASYLAPRPTTRHATVASLQHGASAIVLYEVDLSDSAVAEGRMRLDIEPAEGGMCDEIVVAGRPYDRTGIPLKPGSVIGWRVAGTLVALRLLETLGVEPERPVRRGPVPYQLSPVEDGGLCLDCPLATQPSDSAVYDNLHCGFVIACSTTQEHESLADFLEAFAGWTVEEKGGDGQDRQIDWQTSGARMHLAWNPAGNRVVSKRIDGRPVASPLRYDSPLIRLADGDFPRVTGP